MFLFAADQETVACDGGRPARLQIERTETAKQLNKRQLETRASWLTRWLAVGIRHHIYPTGLLNAATLASVLSTANFHVGSGDGGPQLSLSREAPSRPPSDSLASPAFSPTRGRGEERSSSSGEKAMRDDRRALKALLDGPRRRLGRTASCRLWLQSPPKPQSYQPNQRPPRLKPTHHNFC